MGPPSHRTRVLVGSLVGILALLVVLSTTGPVAEQELTGNFRRLGGPCLYLERWGLFGWNTVGQTQSLTQLTNGDWQPPQANPPCQDVEDQLILVRMPLDAPNDIYRICGLADDRACLTFRLVKFQSTGPGP